MLILALPNSTQHHALRYVQCIHNSSTARVFFLARDVVMDVLAMFSESFDKCYIMTKDVDVLFTRTT